MFQARQIDEVQALTEISKGAASPGAVAPGVTVSVGAVVCTTGAAGVGTQPATFALGDQLEVVPSAGAATNGLQVAAAPTATPGTCSLSFFNATAGSITPTGGAVYMVIATRYQPGVL